MCRKTFALVTLGCRVNQYESEAVREGFLALGYEQVSFSEAARVYLIHSCAVTAESEKKSRGCLSRALRKKKECGALVCVFGCMAQKREMSLYARYPALDLVWGNKELQKLVHALDARLGGKPLPEPDFSLPIGYDSPGVTHWHSPRAFIKIQDGCNSFCSYCVVPYLRGRERCRPEAEILREADILCANGAREIVLTGVETAAYGAAGLVSLAEKLAERPEILRIRFGSLKPTLFDADFCRALGAIPKVMPQFHLSAQSASDAVLAAMRRGYDSSALCAAVEHLRAAFPGAALTGDFICAFPGETDADFEKTVRFITETGFLHCHVFLYSPREKTPAAGLKPLSPACRKERLRRLLAVSQAAGEAEYRRLLPLQRAILIERCGKETVKGHSEHFLELTLNKQAGDRVGALKPIE